MRRTALWWAAMGWTLCLAVACTEDPKGRVGDPCGRDEDCASGLCVDSVCLSFDGDEDDDGLTNKRESELTTDPFDADSDDDGLGDGLEVEGPDGIEGSGDELGCDPLRADTDGDGLADGVEDADADGVQGDTETHPANADTDEDGWSDGREPPCQTSPVDAADVPIDTDDDGDCDEVDEDDDGDGVGDVAELVGRDGKPGSGDESDPTLVDTDGDGLDDAVETYGPDGEPNTGDEHTNPALADTDDDGWPDPAELDCERAPDDAEDTPLDADLDGLCDGVLDGCVDADGDGWGDDAFDTSDCAQGGEGCDDDPERNPGVEDGACDGVDQDCDGVDGPAGGCGCVEGESCEDGSACTDVGVCVEGVCVAPNINCEDGIPCTVDTCSAVTGCEHDATDCECREDGDCDDGVACTVEVCTETYTCAIDSSGCPDCVPADCDDNVACTIDTCDPVLGCIHDASACPCASDGDCDDGISCSADICGPGFTCSWDFAGCTCQSDAECDDGVACTVDACVHETGCEHDYAACACADVTECDDGVACTDDSCDPDVGCSHTPRDCPCLSDGDCEDGDPCTVDTCGADFQCAREPAAPGAGCDDGDPCTENDVCGAEGCAGTARECVPTDDCFVAFCDPVLGCQENPRECDDGDPCTDDVCDPALADCVFTPKDCSTDDLCTYALCDTAAGGCVYEPLECVDGDPCTEDLCYSDAGCVFETLSCDDDDVCTLDSCDPVDGCTHVGVDCDDGNACTDDVCAPDIGCTNTELVGQCDDGDPCTDDVCDAVLGCVNTTRDCDDGDPCTDDFCSLETGLCDHAPSAVRLSCNAVCCPVVDGYEVSCNVNDYCEYFRTDGTAPWEAWDVWIWMPPGAFEMGNPGVLETPQTSEQPVHPVEFAEGFLILRSEVTVDIYEACQADGVCTTPQTHDLDNSFGTNSTAMGRSAHPQNGLSYGQGIAVCGWLGEGGTLPSEAQWEYAASGPTHRVYPWGDGGGPDCQHAVIDESGMPGCGNSTGTETVGSRSLGDAASGAWDMIGNVSEWTLDCWHSDYTGAPTDGSAWQTGCADSDIAAVRGGSYLSSEELFFGLRTASRSGVGKTLQRADMGARCVRPLPEPKVICEGVVCPTLPGYDVACNGWHDCEYTSWLADTAPERVYDSFVWVRPNAFLMGSAAVETESSEDERPNVVVTFPDGFFLGTNEISVGLYAACQQDGACSVPSVAFNDANGWGLNSEANSRSDHPQNGLTWAQARDFCAWLVPGGRLPSEAEWEYSSGDMTNPKYPWGQTDPTCDTDVANFSPEGTPESYGCYTGGTVAFGERTVGHSPFGAAHMAGNVWEWVEDCWHDNYDGLPTDGSAWTALCDSEDRVARGGSFTDPAPMIRNSNRGRMVVDSQAADIGGRCAISVAPRHGSQLYVPPVTAFPMGVPMGQGGPGESPEHAVDVGGFWLDAYEVTVVEFVRFLSEVGEQGCEGQTCIDLDMLGANVVDLSGLGDYAPSTACQSNPGGPNTGSCDDHPVVGVTWYGARAYCEWVGKRLPTEAEWELAAAGKRESYYPWGDGEPTATLVNCDDTLCVADGFSGTAPVGSFAAGNSDYGAFDMAGNAAEWVEDCYHYGYDGAPTDGSAWTIDCSGVGKVVRGGSYSEQAYGLATTARLSYDANMGSPTIGFRCARTPR